MPYIRAAFEHICQTAKEPERCYVILVSSHQAYGGPEEGGWWYDVNTLEAFQEFPTEEQAQAAATAVQALADDLQNESRREYGEHCLRQLDWLEERGLDADYLPEDDGPEEYRVRVVDELPVFNNARPHYC